MAWDRLLRLVTISAALAVLATACIVDAPTIESTQATDDLPEQSASSATSVEPTALAAAPQFEPTAVPVPPTPAPTPTNAPEPTPEPTPIPAITPLPIEGADSDFVPNLIDAGLVAIPVRSITFVLDEARPMLQFPGHSLVYIDDEAAAEVDIFIPFANGSGEPLDSYEAVIDFVESDPAFADVVELDPQTVNGSPARVFEGLPVTDVDALQRSFGTDASTLDDDQLGWFAPVRLRMWIIDGPDGTVILTAESLEDPGRFVEAVELAESILSTISFGQEP